MAKLKIALTILAALTVGSGTIGTAPATSPSNLPSLQRGAGEGAATGLSILQRGAGEGAAAGLPSLQGGAGEGAGPSRVPPACPPVLGAPAPIFLCQPCPGVIANPTGLCPPTAPPPAVRPVIAFCPQPPIVLRPVPGTIELHGFVCGRGFRGSETVTITALSLIHI